MRWLKNNQFKFILNLVLIIKMLVPTLIKQIGINESARMLLFINYVKSSFLFVNFTIKKLHVSYIFVDDIVLIKALFILVIIAYEYQKCIVHSLF